MGQKSLAYCFVAYMGSGHVPNAPVEYSSEDEAVHVATSHHRGYFVIFARQPAGAALIKQLNMPSSAMLLEIAATQLASERKQRWWEVPRMAALASEIGDLRDVANDAVVWSTRHAAAAAWERARMEGLYRKDYEAFQLWRQKVRSRFGV